MKIRGLRTRVVQVPLRQRVVSRSGVFDSMWYLLVDLETDEGVDGLAYLWAFSAAGAAALRQVLAELAEVAVGESPFYSARLWQRMWSRMTQWGHAGLAVIGMSAIDVAAWDVVGKALGQPLALLLGAHAERVPAYASEGLWLTDDLPDLARQAEALVGQGFRALKMRLGRASAADDLEAARLVRAAVGPDVALMVDVNQGWTVERAIRIGRQLEPINLYWLEDPIPHDDLDGHAKIAAALDTPIATGERAYAPAGVRALIERQACDILMPDVQRVGGVTGWMRAAALADAWSLPICSHLFTEISVHLVAAAPTACYLEHMPWTFDLFQERLKLVDGHVPIPNRPGLGFSWDEAAIRRVLAE